jgi:ribosomal protein S18 acetylase RimI-like enzyme
MISFKEIIIKEHYAAISHLMLGLHNSEKELFSKGDDWKNIEKNYMQYVIDLQEEHNGTCIVALDGEIMIGFIFGYSYFQDEEEDRTEIYTGEELYVSDGFIEATHRRLGIYKQLNTLLENKYIAKGVRKIVRFTLSSNDKMQAFLEKNKYTVVRLQYEKWLTPDGENAQDLGLKKEYNFF